MKNAVELSLFPDMEVSDRKVERSWRERVRGQGMLRLDLLQNGGDWEDGFPVIAPFNGGIPNGIVDFKTAKAYHSCSPQWVHFFIDDVHFNELWNARYTQKDLLLLKKFGGIFSPDYSLLLSMPLALKAFNVYRNRLIGQLFQRNGGNVIPTVSWAERDSYGYCFKGLPRDGVVAISTNGVRRNVITRKFFYDGLFEMERRIHPSKIIVYGEKLEMQTKANLVFFENERLEHMRDL